MAALLADAEDWQWPVRAIVPAVDANRPCPWTVRVRVLSASANESAHRPHQWPRNRFDFPQSVRRGGHGQSASRPHPRTVHADIFAVDGNNANPCPHIVQPQSTEHMIDAKRIRKAREILGEDAAGKTDAQIAEIIAGLDAIADMVIDCYIEQRRKAAKNSHEKRAA